MRFSASVWASICMIKSWSMHSSETYIVMWFSLPGFQFQFFFYLKGNFSKFCHLHLPFDTLIKLRPELINFLLPSRMFWSLRQECNLKLNMPHCILSPEENCAAINFKPTSIGLFSSLKDRWFYLFDIVRQWDMMVWAAFSPRQAIIPITCYKT